MEMSHEDLTVISRLLAERDVLLAAGFGKNLSESDYLSRRFKDMNVQDISEGVNLLNVKSTPIYWSAVDAMRREYTKEFHSITLASIRTSAVGLVAAALSRMEKLMTAAPIMGLEAEAKIAGRVPGLIKLAEDVARDGSFHSLKDVEKLHVPETVGIPDSVGGDDERRKVLERLMRISSNTIKEDAKKPVDIPQLGQ
jgi:hypothetical protein